MGCVLSDLGGVVVTVDFDRVMGHWAGRGGRSLDDVAFPFDEAFARFEVGGITEQAYFAHLREHLGLDISHEDLVEGWERLFVGLDLRVLGLLERVRDAGHRVVAVTNTNETHEGYWRRQYPELDTTFDHIYSSAALRVRKPDAEFFDVVLEREQVAADDALLFVDDLAANVDGARAVGIPGHHYTNPEGLEEALRQQGLLPMR